MSKEEKKIPIHFTQAYGIKSKEKDLDFFDVNLLYDSRVFIDPFLIKKSSRKVEQKLFTRFGDFFRKAYDLSTNINRDRGEIKQLTTLFNIHEPREIGLGYTEHSHEGSGPGQSFATRLLNFFLENAARKFLRETEVYQKREFNPVTLEIFIDELGPDGISDISANLIMDYLIKYTQTQCRVFRVPLKSLPVRSDGFNFEEMEWNGGGYYDLPENTCRPGMPVILVPKRFLRAPGISEESMATTVKGILAHDQNLAEKFSTFLHKSVDEIGIQDIRLLFLQETEIFKKYLQHLGKETKPYDFKTDILKVLAIKTYGKYFGSEVKTEIKDCDNLLNKTLEFIKIISDHFSRSDGWQEAWKKEDGKITPQTEVAIGRIFRAMGFSFFHWLPEVTFEPEVDMGNGSVDFKIIFKNCRIVIELKKLSNSSNSGNPPLPAYIHGIKRQLPDYAYTSRANHAIYITGQHHTHAFNPKSHHDDRILEIEALIPEVEKQMKDARKEFQSLRHINIIMTPRRSASRL